MWRSLFEDAIRPAIAFFYATGVAVDGITGPFLFGKMIESSEESQVAIAFFLGAAVMAVGGIVGLLSGVKAVQQSLEDIAEPLTEQDAEGAGDRDHDEAAAAPSAQRPGSELAAGAAAGVRERRRRFRLGPGRTTAYSPSGPSGASWCDFALGRSKRLTIAASVLRGRRSLARAAGVS